MGASESDSRQTKVERVIEAYDLSGLDSTLVARWTASGDDRWSLRELADFVNESLLEAALQDAGEQMLTGEVENYYRLLQGDTASAGERTEAERHLERVGVDVEELRTDFVSHQAVHTFLTDRKDVRYERASDEERVESVRETIKRLETRTETVAENALGDLASAERLDLENFSVITSVAVICEECGTRHDLDSLIGTGGCECQ